MPVISKLLFEELCYAMSQTPANIPLSITKTKSKVGEAFFQLRLSDEDIYEDLLQLIDGFIPGDDEFFKKNDTPHASFRERNTGNCLIVDKNKVSEVTDPEKG